MRIDSKRRTIAALMAVVCLMLSAPAAEAAKPAAQFSSDLAVRWFSLLHGVIKTEKLNPVVASRVIGYSSVAFYEALAPGMPHHRSLVGQLNELDSLQAVRPGRNFDWPSVANAAMARTLRAFFAAATPDSLAQINALELEIASARQAAVKSKLQSVSAAQGRAVADAVLAWAGGDGFATANNCPFTPPAGPGLWVPTLPLFKPALQPCWGQLRPFVLSSGGECAPPPPPAYSIDPSSEFYAQANEVFTTVNTLTPVQEEIALFWSDDPGPPGTPPGHWVSIVNQLAVRDGYTLEEAAEAYARVGIAVADAFISCWQVKFQHNLLRPITYIQSVFNPAWLPLLATPAFPEYTSGHSVQSGAAAQTLTDMLGDVAFTDHTHDARGLAPRSFASFAAAADEAAISRLYGGIHYREAIAKGLEQGRCIAGAIRDRVIFRKDQEPED
ncbi:MAG TPA: vanadium-dependent haloperoxidase [Patescibacteria group bacterium]|nr:vanadium-dependent haloperoxidase [Patescibacteria group bacterium]